MSKAIAKSAKFIRQLISKALGAFNVESPTEIIYRERLKKLSLLLTGDDGAFLAEDDRRFGEVVKVLTWKSSAGKDLFGVFERDGHWDFRDSGTGRLVVRAKDGGLRTLGQSLMHQSVTTGLGIPG